MAIDTNNDKLSLISMLKPWEVPIPQPSGDSTIDQADKQHLIWGYSGVLWAVPVVSVVNPVRRFIVNVNRLGLR